jgi:hypothetical protein
MRRLAHYTLTVLTMADPAVCRGAFAPTVVRERGVADRTMAAGSVLWVTAGENLEVMARGAGAAHVLAVRLLK